MPTLAFTTEMICLAKYEEAGFGSLDKQSSETSLNISPHCSTTYLSSRRQGGNFTDFVPSKDQNLVCMDFACGRSEDRR